MLPGRFQFSLLHLMLFMTAVAVGAAWLPTVWEPLKWICMLTAPIAGMCLPAHHFRGLDGFGRGVAFCGLFGYCGSMICAELVAQRTVPWLGQDWGLPLGILVGGFLGGAITGFIAGAAGAVVAKVLDDLT